MTYHNLLKHRVSFYHEFARATEQDKKRSSYLPRLLRGFRLSTAPALRRRSHRLLRAGPGGAGLITTCSVQRRDGGLARGEMVKGQNNCGSRTLWV